MNTIADFDWMSSVVPKKGKICCIIRDLSICAKSELMSFAQGALRRALRSSKGGLKLDFF